MAKHSFSKIRRKTVLIQILGAGCSTCDKLAIQAEEAAKKSGVEYTLEKVTEIDKIISFGVMVTPALVIDGKLKCSGSVPNVDQIVTMLKQ